MAMVKLLNMYWQRRQAHRLGLRLRSVRNISSEANLQVALPANLGHVAINVPAVNGQPATFGAYSYIKSGELGAIKAIGKYCSIGTNVVIGKHGQNHALAYASTYPSFQDNYAPPEKYTVIGHDVWIGDNAVVMAGVTVGDGAVIGMNAIVTKDVQPYEIVGGVPARHIRYRFSEVVIQGLLDAQWWNLPDDVLKTLDFSNVEQFLQALQRADYPPVATGKTLLLKKKAIVFE